MNRGTYERLSKKLTCFSMLSSCALMLLAGGFAKGQETRKASAQQKSEVGREQNFKDYLTLASTDPIFKTRKTFDLTVVFPIPVKRGVVVTDGTENAFFNLSEQQWGKGTQWKIGNRFRGSGLILRQVNRLKIVETEVLQKLPRDEAFEEVSRPLPKNPSRELLRPFNLHPVILEGRILNAVQSSGRLRLEIKGDGFRYKAECPAVFEDTIFANVGASLKIDGLFWYPYKETTVDTPLDTPVVYFLSLKAMSLFKNEQANFDSVSGELVDIFGNGTAFLLEDGEAKLTEMRIFSHAELLPPQGHRIDCWGHRAKMRDGKVTFNVSAFRAAKDQTQRSAESDVKPSPYRAGDQKQHLKMISVLGALKGDPSADLQQGFFTLYPEAGNDPIRVILPTTNPLVDEQLPNAREVRVTGYLDLTEDKVKIYPLYLHQIEVLGETPWVQTEAFRWVALGALGLILGGFIWVAALRRVVKRRTEALDGSLSLLNASYDAVYEGICVVDSHGSVRKTNLRFWELLGLSEEDLEGLTGEELGGRIAECFKNPQEFRDLWKRLANDHEVKETGEFHLVHSEEGEVRFDSVPAPTSKGQHQPVRVWVFKDMTEQRRLEFTLLQSQKMEAVGRLAGGVAHDFNNLLTGILGNLDAAQSDPAVPVGQLSSPLNSAGKAAKRAAELVASLLGFSRQEKLSPFPSCANEVVRQLASLVEPTLGPKIALQVDLEEDLKLAAFDPIKLEQVILNMVVNARDELEDSGGKIVITTQTVAASHPETGVRGRYVRACVADNANGMPESVRNRIFEPFFTTKEPGKGTGLGLATSYGIIKQMNGWIECESQLGEGHRLSCFPPRSRCPGAA